MKKVIYAIFLVIGLAGVSLQLFLLRKDANQKEIIQTTTGAANALQGVEADGRFKQFGKLPPFSLVERSGERVSLDALKGKVWLADFIFTNCPDICPLLNHRIVGIQEELLAAGENVAIVSFSVDPSNDSPEVLRDYADHLGADKRWLFLTGEKSQIRTVALNGFKLAFYSEEGMKPEEITHSSKIALVDQNGVVRRYYEGVTEDESARMLEDVKLLLKEGAQ